MALLYEFNSGKFLASRKYIDAAETIAKLEKALAAKKIAKPKIDEFVKSLKAHNFAPIRIEAQRYVEKNTVAKGLVPVKANQSAIEKAWTVAIMGPQRKLLMAKFDLSVHQKGTNLEMQHTDCKGKYKVLFTTAL